MVQINRVTAIGYSLVIEGNGGEEELVIQTSAGQGGHVAMQATATACDGGRHGKSNWNIPYGTHDNKQMKEAIAELVQEWGANLAQAQAVAKMWYGEVEVPRTEYMVELFNGAARELA